MNLTTCKACASVYEASSEEDANIPIAFADPLDRLCPGCLRSAKAAAREAAATPAQMEA